VGGCTSIEIASAKIVNGFGDAKHAAIGMDDGCADEIGDIDLALVFFRFRQRLARSVEQRAAHRFPFLALFLLRGGDAKAFVQRPMFSPASAPPGRSHRPAAHS
jgi:hypothetical protein